jgi:hypothetical protein
LKKFGVTAPYEFDREHFRIRALFSVTQNSKTISHSGTFMAITRNDLGVASNQSLRDDRVTISEEQLKQVNNDNSYSIADTGIGPSTAPLPEDVDYLNRLAKEINDFRTFEASARAGVNAHAGGLMTLSGDYTLSRAEQEAFAYRAAEALDRLGGDPSAGTGYLWRGTGQGLWLPSSGSNIPDSPVTRERARVLNLDLRNVLAF